MMNDFAIRVEGISKLYRIGKRLRYKTLRDTLSKSISSSFRSNSSNGDNAIWALKDISFEVKQGEVLGVIGRNGAGKSTLLKILSRVTEPTEGRARICGRVGSLLEVGTGFHPELTGRENIYLNGAILGMKRKEMESKFDEILAFAEIDKFIDTPVKHYSSGMYVRLAFAVAAHLEPEILLIDEVLAVGDAAFQKKCLGKMDDVTKEGRTVLFVSHNMPMILRLCHRGILLENGRIAGSGNVQKIIEQYLAGAQSISSLNDLSRCSRNGSGKIRFKEFCVSNEDGNPWLYPDQPALFRMKLETDTPGLLSSNVKIAIGVNAGTGERILELHTKFDHEYQKELFPFEKDTTIVCKTKAFPIKPGIYYLTLYVDYSHELCDGLKDVIQIEVRESDFFETGVLPSNTQGWLLLNQHWSQEK